MNSQILFESIGRAASAGEVFDLLDEYAASFGFSEYENLPMRAVGDHENNRGLIEALASVDAAAFEKVMNGHDAVIDLWLQQNTFETNPTTPAEALAEIGEQDSPQTWIITSRDKSPVGPGRPPKRANVTIVDKGVGIPAARFSETIMSLQGSNKITDPRFAGSFGYGGSTLYRFSEVSLVYSRSRLDPNKVAFTVVLKVQKEGWKSYSYNWLHDGQGNALVADIGEIPSALIADPDDLNVGNILEWANQRIIMPNSHGTAIKVYGLNAFTDQAVAYNTLRQLGFGIPARVGLRHGIPQVGPESDDDDDSDEGTAGGRRRIYNVKGLRFALNEPRGKNAHPVLFHQAPISIMAGRATLECWILGESERTRTTQRPKQGTPVQRVLGSKEEVTSPIFVTLNGQTHATLPTAVLLRRASLPYLSGNLILEINCDRMDAIERGTNFASNREHVTDAMRDDVKLEIEKYLREEGGEDGALGKLNRRFRDELLATSTAPEAARAGVERFAKMMQSSLAGAVFSSVGASHNKLQGTGAILSLGAPRRKAGTRAEVALQAIPDWLEVRKSTIQSGDSEYITIRTNAVNDFGDALDLSLPDFLVTVGADGTSGSRNIPTIALRDGRASYYVKCGVDVPVGSVGSITVSLDRSRLNLPSLVDSTTVVVVKRERSEMRMKPLSPDRSSGTGLPELNAIMVRPSEHTWQAIHAGSLSPEDVAYYAVPNENTGIVDIFINAEFPALTHVANEAQKKFRDPAIVERLRDDYQFAIKLAVLSSLESKLDELFGDQVGAEANFHRLKSANAKVFAMSCWESFERLAKPGGARLLGSLGSEEAA